MGSEKRPAREKRVLCEREILVYDRWNGHLDETK